MNRFSYKLSVLFYNRFDKIFPSICESVDNIKSCKNTILEINNHYQEKYGHGMYYVDGMTQDILYQCEITIRQEYKNIFKLILLSK